MGLLRSVPLATPQSLHSCSVAPLAAADGLARQGLEIFERARFSSARVQPVSRPLTPTPSTLYTMDCACRTAALRLFVKSIAQINVPTRTTPLRAQYQALSHGRQPSRLYNHKPASGLATPSRTLHTSCVRSSAAEAPRAAEEEAGWVKDGGATETENTPRESADRPSKPKTRDAHADPTSWRAQNKKAWQEKSEKSDKTTTGKPKADKKPFKPRRDPSSPPKQKEPWMAQKDALTKKFPTGWNPRKKLSPDALVGIRMLHQQFPDEYPTEVLAQKFEVSAEAIRRILRSKWAPDADTEAERQQRWFERGKKVWTHWAALGKKPPRKWRAEGVVRDPVWNRPRGPVHKDKGKRAEAQRRLAKGGLVTGQGEWE